MVTHGVAHLHKCDSIVVVSRGEVTDYGPYKQLINRSKILQDFVYSTNTEQIERRSSDAGKVKSEIREIRTMNLARVFLFHDVIASSRKSSFQMNIYR